MSCPYDYQWPKSLFILNETWKNNINSEEILKQKCVTDYNKAKKTVDFSDQMSSYNTSVRKSLKLYRKVVFKVLLGTAVVNAGIVYNMITNLGITEFRKNSAETIIVCKTPVNEIQTSIAPLRKWVHTFVKPEAGGWKNVICVKDVTCNYGKLWQGKLWQAEKWTKKLEELLASTVSVPNSPGFCSECFDKQHN